HRIVAGDFPQSDGGPGVLDAADAWLADAEDAPFRLRRIIVERRATVARQEKVRAADLPWARDGTATGTVTDLAQSRPSQRPGPGLSSEACSTTPWTPGRCCPPPPPTTR